MSGNGVLQKRIRRALWANTDRALLTSQLAAWCYPRWRGSVSQNQRRAIVRAAEGVARRVGRLWRGRCSKTPGGVLWRAKP
jgi:hypothetical protein